ncbi:hypothetical protein MAXJ12_31809, partial [Mesorhizobium alhagi CCNWXJ12-2]
AGTPPAAEAAAEAAGLTPLPKAALDKVPSVEEIVAKGVVRRE